MPDWVGPVARYVLEQGLPETLRLAATAVVCSTAVGIVLGTLLTIRFLPLRAVIRLYVEVWRGLPIIVTIFLIYFALPGLLDIRFGPFTAAAIGLTLWAAPRSPKRHAAPCSRSRASSMQPPRHSASRGPAGTAT